MTHYFNCGLTLCHFCSVGGTVGLMVQVVSLQFVGWEDDPLCDLPGSSEDPGFMSIIWCLSPYRLLAPP